MSKYITSDVIEKLSLKVENTLTPTVRSKFIAICSKYKLPFTASNVENTNMVWKHTKELLYNSPKRVLRNGKTVEASQEGALIINNCIIEYNELTFTRDLETHILDLINEIYGKDYDFICEFEGTKIMNVIEAIYSEIEVPSPTFAEIIRVTNYEKYFAEKLGVQSLNKTEFETTKRIAKYYDTIFADVKNKDLAFDAVRNYLQTGEISNLHNTLFA